jgi:serine/threonine protein kinase
VVTTVCKDKSESARIEDFTVRRLIGLGGFSTVVEVRKNSSGKLYAMKLIKKEMIEKKDKVKQIMME